ncbi:hypothetical protein V8G54_036224 [Vigna mungo]|uniref:Uncharacterized protein n=1 Tax=Vigna mungo TaxID=3915 RepID=A0AAQ3MGY4_VIGMU
MAHVYKKNFKKRKSSVLDLRKINKRTIISQLRDYYVIFFSIFNSSITLFFFSLVILGLFVCQFVFRKKNALINRTKVVNINSSKNNLICKIFKNKVRNNYLPSILPKTFCQGPQFWM